MGLAGHDPEHVQIVDADAANRAFVSRFCKLLADEGVAFDIEAHRAAPSGLRVWCGATVETTDVVALAPWLDWAWAELLP